MVAGLKKLLTKLFLFIIFPVAAVIIYFIVTGNSATDLFGSSLGDLSTSLKDVARSYRTAAEIMSSAASLTETEVEVRGLVHIVFYNPDYVGTSYAIDTLPVKISADKIELWQRALNQQETVRGILTSKTVTDQTSGKTQTIYYLDNPTILN